MARRKTNEEFVKEAYELVGDEYIFLEEYITSNEKILCRHNICGHMWKVRPSNFLFGTRCPQCSKIETDGLKRLSYKDVKYFIEVESGSDCKLLSKKYINNNTKMQFKCKCGNEFKATYSNFTYGNKRQCNQCGNKVIGQKLIKTNKEFKSEVYKLVGNEYEVIGEYRGSDKYILIKHSVCGYEWEIRPNNFISSGQRCPRCAGNAKKDTEQFKQEVYKLVEHEYEILGEYVNSQTQIAIKHTKCGHEWKVIPNSFLCGSRCPQCEGSKGEQIIKKHLESNKIDYIKEYTYDNLVGVNGGLLRYDFYLPRYDILIEYDGEFHYKQLYDGDGFETLQIHDKRKDQYCKDNNIPLLRIPYWDFDNIGQTLEEWLENHGVLQKDKKNSIVYENAKINVMPTSLQRSKLG